MKKFASFLVHNRNLFLCLMLCLVAICAMLIPKVEINYDMTKYLSDDSGMAKGLQLMGEEFPDEEAAYTVRVMLKGLTEQEAASSLSALTGLENVSSVTRTDKDGYTLFTVTTPYAYQTSQETALEKAIAAAFPTAIVKNDDSATTAIPLWILLLAVFLVLVVLLLLSASYFQPLLMLSAIGAAIVLNLGTNVFFGSISNITFAIAAILQLVLSMDYSVILLNRYRQEQQQGLSSVDAMISALSHAFSSITASALTTIVGLLALLFMQMKIGADLGLVLAKGVLCSVIVMFTMLPGMILLFDKYLLKTAKPVPVLNMAHLGAFSFRFRKVISVAFAVLMISVYILQSATGVAFSLKTEDPIAEVFPTGNTIVLLYNRKDEEAMPALLDALYQEEGVTSLTCYQNTLGKQYTLQEMTSLYQDQLPMDASALSLFYYLANASNKMHPVPLGNLLGFIVSLSSSPAYASLVPEGAEQFAAFISADALTEGKTSDQLADIFQLPVQQVAQLTKMAAMQSGTDSNVSVQQFITFLSENVLTTPAYAAAFAEGDIARLMALKQLTDAVCAGQTVDGAALSALLTFLGTQTSEDTANLLLTFYLASVESNPDWVASLPQLLNTASALAGNPQYAALLGKDTTALLANAQVQLAQGEKQLLGSRYSRLILTCSFSADSAKATAFFDNLNTLLSEHMTQDHYLIGTSAMNYEMRQSFSSEMLTITLISALAIFMVVAFTFRSLFIPLLLVLLVQCGIYTTIVLIGVQGYSIYYMALLVVQCILMGSTIDYAILFTNYYREKRATLPVKDSISAALNGAIHTITTSGLIMVLVCAVIGWCFSEPTIGQICQTISIGSLCAVLLILFVLPSLLALADRWVTQKKA